MNILLRCFLLAGVFFCSSLWSKTIILSTIQRPPISTIFSDGFADSVATQAFDRLGINLIIQNIPAKRALVNANRGISDGDLARIEGVEKSYPNLIRVPEIIWIAEINAFSKDPSITLQHWRDLKHFSLAYIRGWVVFDNNVPKTAMINKVLLPEALFKVVERERVQLALYEKKMGLSVIKQLAIRNVYPVNDSLLNTPIYIYLHKKHRKIVPLLTKAIKAMKQDGSYDAIMQRTLGEVLTPEELKGYKEVQNSIEEASRFK